MPDELALTLLSLPFPSPHRGPKKNLYIYIYMYVCMDVCMYKEMFFAEPHGLSSYGPMIYL